MRRVRRTDLVLSLPREGHQWTTQKIAHPGWAHLLSRPRPGPHYPRPGAPRCQWRGNVVGMSSDDQDDLFFFNHRLLRRLGAQPLLLLLRSNSPLPLRAGEGTQAAAVTGPSKYPCTVVLARQVRQKPHGELPVSSHRPSSGVAPELAITAIIFSEAEGAAKARGTWTRPLSEH